MKGEDMKKNLCDYCEYATYDCCEYYGGYKQWFVDGCKKDADYEATKDEYNRVIECDEFESIKNEE